MQGVSCGPQVRFVNVRMSARQLHGTKYNSLQLLTFQIYSGRLNFMNAFLHLYPNGAILKNIRNIFWRVAPVIMAGAVFAAVGCVRVKMDPIHITMDVNVKVDKELDSFFEDLDAKAATGNVPAPKPVEKGSLP